MVAVVDGVDAVGGGGDDGEVFAVEGFADTPAVASSGDASGVDDADVGWVWVVDGWDLLGEWSG